jgi:hypothetical protein
VSLINDALKRARHQALEQDADGKTVSYRAVPAHSRRSERRWMPYLIGGGTVAMVMAGFLLMQRDTGPEVQTPATAIAASEGPEEPAPIASEAAEEAEVKTPDASQSVVEFEPGLGTDERPSKSESLPRTADTPRTGGLSLDDGQGQVEPREERDTSSEETSVDQRAGARLEAGKTYLRRVVAMDGGDVVLGGIAYSEARPIAVINGSVVTPGDMISGFTVIAITPEHVQLEADGTRIFLALH